MPGRRAIRRSASAVAALLAVVGAVVPACARLPASTFTSGRVEPACCGRSDEPVELRFLGVGGWVLRKGSTAVMTAPLYSNPSLVQTGLGEIAPDTARIERHLPDVADVRAILVGHGHYDHLMDVPYVARERAPDAVVYGNETSRLQILPMGVPDARIRVFRREELGAVDGAGAWIPVAPGARIMPLRSHHGPHIAGITLYSGVRTHEMPLPPRTAREWLDGHTVAFLVDLLNADGSVALRVYYQDAVAAPPYGLVPPLDDGVGVDVAILVPATFEGVDWHPEAIVESADPNLVLLGHWEDFFRSPDLRARPGPPSDLSEFLDRLERALPEGSTWALPMPGTRFVLN